MAGSSVLRIGIAGCGRAARIHLDRLLAAGRGRRRRLRRSRPRTRPGAGGAGRAGRGIGAGALFRRPSRAPEAAGARRPVHLHAPPLALPAGDGRPPGRVPRVHREAAVDQPAGGRRHRRAGPGTRASRSRWGISTGSGPAWWKPAACSSEGEIGPLRLVTATLAQPWLATQGRARGCLAVRPQGRRRRHPRRRRRPPDRRPPLDDRPGRAWTSTPPRPSWTRASTWSPPPRIRLSGRHAGDPGRLRRLARLPLRAELLRRARPDPGHRLSSWRWTTTGNRPQPVSLPEPEDRSTATSWARCCVAGSALLPGRAGARHGPADRGHRTIRRDRSGRPARLSDSASEPAASSTPRRPSELRSRRPTP